MFHFISTWRLPAPPERVWREMADVESWSRWWPGCTESTVISAGSPDGLGRHGRLVVRSPLGFALRFDMEIVMARRPHEARVSVDGDLVGSGNWRMREADSGALADIGWDVDIARRGLRVAAVPLRRPMIWAHDRVMDAGERGLAARLDLG